MGSAVNKVVSSVVDPFGLTEKVTGINMADPLGIFDDPEPPEDVPESKAGLSETEKATLARQEAARKKKQAKSGTSTVLTSPLGATTTAKTAVTKLGGA